ncbi:hypothetical protein SESBI_10513 [Sesbania bispinosa]|nr:hypothetical protein SESBI_10513 [Sesbania bispinosa]
MENLVIQGKSTQEEDLVQRSTKKVKLGEVSVEDPGTSGDGQDESEPMEESPILNNQPEPSQESKSVAPKNANQPSAHTPQKI